jgi:hypothetical protein
MTTTIQVNVGVTPAGPSQTDGVNWSFSAGPDTPAGAVQSDGTIDLDPVPTPAGNPTVDVVFALQNPTISWSTGPAIGTFNMSFFGADHGALDAIRFGRDGQPKTIYSGDEFHSLGMGGAYQTATIEDKDDDHIRDWNYGLVVWVNTNQNGPGTGICFFKDPPWKNKD